MAEKALQLFEAMRQHGLQANVITHTAVISACEKGILPDRALQLFEKMQEVSTRQLDRCRFEGPGGTCSSSVGLQPRVCYSRIIGSVAVAFSCFTVPLRVCCSRISGSVAVAFSCFTVPLRVCFSRISGSVAVEATLSGGDGNDVNLDAVVRCSKRNAERTPAQCNHLLQCSAHANRAQSQRGACSSWMECNRSNCSPMSPPAMRL